MTTLLDLPFDLFLVISSTLDCFSLSQLGQITPKIYQLFGGNKGLWELMRAKLQKQTRLKLAAFSRQDLQGLSIILASQPSPHLISAGLRASLIITNDNQEIASVSAGENAGMILTTQGEVWLLPECQGVWTDLIRLSQFHPEKLDTTDIGPIVSISAQEEEPFGSLLLNARGEVFSYTRGAHVPLTSTHLMGIIVTISAAGILPLLVNSIGQVFTLDYLDDQSIQIIPLNLGFPVRATANEKFNSLVLDLQGKVWRLPDDLDFIYRREEPSLELIDCHELGEVVTISSGRAHSLLLNSRGQVFGTGNNRWGQLGIADCLWNKLRLVSDDKVGKIIAISAGSRHSLFLNSEGEVWGFGSNEWGQLGSMEMSFSRTPILVGHL
jgi:hypothetical protein